MSKRTKIICTIGPATDKRENILAMIHAGMNVARLNFSHGTYAEHERTIKLIRTVAEETQEPIAIMQDLQGPKIRVGIVPPEGIELLTSSVVDFDTKIIGYENHIIPISYHELHQYVKKGDRLLLNDGKIETKIIRVENTRINAEVVVGGHIISHQGINVPDSVLPDQAFTEKDKADLRFGVAHDVDLVAVSFVERPEDVLDVRYAIKAFEKELNKPALQPIAVIAKIERGEAVKNIEAIVKASDGIMVARGDLGVEVPAAEVPLIQKRLIDVALTAGKPVIVATQMLDSMQSNPRPTRAEVSDVANAVIDHTDAVMLSNETATGKYPVEAVTMMAQIIHETEGSVYDNLSLKSNKRTKAKKSAEPLDDIISGLARLLAERVDASLILAASLTGDTGRLISRFRPELPIFVGSPTERVRHQLNLSWGVFPFPLPQCATIEELLDRSVLYLKKAKLVKTGDKAVVVAGEPVGQSGHVNLLEVREVK